MEMQNFSSVWSSHWCDCTCPCIDYCWLHKTSLRGDVELLVNFCSICKRCSVAEGICIAGNDCVPEMSLLLLPWLLLKPKEFVGGDEKDELDTVDADADTNADEQFNEEYEEDIVEEDDDGVSIILVSVCEATKEAH